jgi:type VI secretion system protein ImpA
MADLDAFLDPIAGPDPAGEELRNDPRFHQIERDLEPAARDRRRETLASGGTGNAALDWGGLLDQARDLAASGRDVRLLVIAVRAAVAQEGFDGLAQGLTMLAETANRHWAHLHPTLRENPSKQQAALRRINAFKQIENAENGLLCDLEYNTAAQARGMGLVSGADLAAAALTPAQQLGERTDAMNDKDRAEFLAEADARANRVTGVLRALQAERPDDLKALAEGVAASQSALAALEAALDAHVLENGVGVRFTAFAKFLTRIAATLSAYSVAETAQPQGEVMAPVDAAVTAGPAPVAGAMVNGAVPAAGPAPMPARITTRAEVERALDLIIDYYEKIEPSSPIPHLAKRMRKMVPMNFLQLMAELAPSGMKDFQGVVGNLDEKK